MDIKAQILKLKEGMDERQLQLLFCGAVVFFIILVLLFVHRPLAMRLQSSKVRLRQINLELVEQRKIIDTLKNMDISEKLMSQLEVSSAIDDLTEFGRSIGIKFLSITPQEKEYNQDGNFSILPIAFKIESAYRSLGVFFEYLEEFPRTIVGVEDVSIRSKVAVDSLDVELMISLYMEAENGQK